MSARKLRRAARLGLCLLLVLLAAPFACLKSTRAAPDAPPPVAQASKVLTLWLMPIESVPVDLAQLPGARRKPPQPGVDRAKEYEIDVHAFNAHMEKLGVKVINTTEHPYIDQLLAPHPDYVIQNLDLIAAQHNILTTLGQLAREMNVTVQVLFVTWAQAFEQLAHVEETRYPPDVAQVGSTWVEYFAAHGVLAPPVAEDDDLLQAEPVGRLCWRTSPALHGAPASLKYSTDLRLLYYWKCRPGSEAPRLSLTPGSKNEIASWGDLCERLAGYHVALRQHQGESGKPQPEGGTATAVPAPPAPPHYPMVFPIEFNTNLLHDFLMLAEAEDGKFIDGTKAVFDSKSALKVPMLLTSQATHAADGAARKAPDKPGARTARLFSFPLVQHEVCSQSFMNNQYLAILEPPAFLNRWHRHFSKAWPKKNFWDYAGIAVPRATYLGGSDLMVLHRGPNRREAFRLVRALASDERSTGVLSGEGHLPAQFWTDDSAGLPDMRLRLRPFVDKLRESVSTREKYLGSSDATKREAGLQAFADAVAAVLKTKDKRREHAVLEKFPSVESREVLFATQTIWMRMAEGNPEGVEAAATSAARAINLLIDPPTKCWEFVKSYGPFMALAVLVCSLFFVYHWKKVSQRDRLARLSIDAMRHRDYVTEGAAGRYLSDADALTPNQRRLLVEVLDQLRGKALEFEKRLGEELEAAFHFRSGSPRNAVAAYDLVREAWDFGMLQLRFGFPERPVPELRLDPKLRSFTVTSFPYHLPAVLHQWFYNAAKEYPDPYGDFCFSVDLWQQAKVLGIQVVAPTLFVKKRVACFLRESSHKALSPTNMPDETAKAFLLVSDLCNSAFGHRPCYVWRSTTGLEQRLPDDEPREGFVSVLTLRLPLKRSNEVSYGPDRMDP